MNGRVLVGAGIVVALAGCGDEETQYTYANSSDCFKDVGETRVVGTRSTSGQAVRISAQGGKTYDVFFLPNGSNAKSYAEKLKIPNGILHTKGNAIVYGHQMGTGPAVSEDEVNEVEDCLA